MYSLKSSTVKVAVTIIICIGLVCDSYQCTVREIKSIVTSGTAGIKTQDSLNCM